MSEVISNTTTPPTKPIQPKITIPGVSTARPQQLPSAAPKLDLNKLPNLKNLGKLLK